MSPLLAYTDRTFSLPTLVAAAGELCAGLRAQADERVRQAPDERTVRYYQTVGVLDRPLRYDGRVAVYGYRHLLQVVAVKALQGEGLSLAQVQAALAGTETSALEQAVSEAMGASAALATLRKPPPAAEPESPGAGICTTPKPRPLLTSALAPGVWLTVDPANVSDPEALMASLSLTVSSALNTRSSS